MPLRVLGSAGVSHGKLGGWRLARLARDHGLISEETLSAVGGWLSLANLTAHSPGDQISTDRARDYLALADAVQYALRARPSS